MSLTSTVVETCLDRLPAQTGPEALSAARRCLIDSLACACSAADEAPISILRKTFCGRELDGESSVIGHEGKARADEAALINGTMISLQLFDDTHMQMRAHPSGPLLPAVLAVGEAGNKKLAEALTAFVVGCELQCRLGLALNPSHYEIGWHATSTQGIMGATIASALLLGLDHLRAANALGIAASMSSGLRRNFGTMTMSLHSGLAACNGVRAARLAAAGYTADPNVFDGAMSYGEVFAPEWSSAAMAEDLKTWGNPFSILVPGPGVKLFPLGRPSLAAVDAVMMLQQKHRITAADVDNITCEVSFMYPRTLLHSRPVNGLQGKTSLQYCVAATVVDGRPSLGSFTDEAVRRPEIGRLIDRIEVRVPPELSEDVPEVRKKPFEQPVTVCIRTRDGRTLSETVRYAKGEPQNPASDDDLRRKFEDCTRLRPRQAEAVLQYVQSGEASVRGLFELLRGR